MVDKYEKALVSLANGKVDTEVWREVAAASPSTFCIWANEYKELQTESILSACWLYTRFRRRFVGYKLIAEHIEKFHEDFISEDFEAIEHMQSFTDEKAAASLLRYALDETYPKPETLRLLENYPKKQSKLLLGKSVGYYNVPNMHVIPEVAVEYIENAMFRGGVVAWLLSHGQKEIKSWNPRKVQDPVMGYIFGGPNIVKQLNASEFRHLGYLSLLNVKDENWTASFQQWLLRHSRFHKDLMENFCDVELLRDLGELDDEFFTDRRLDVLEDLLGVMPKIKLRAPPMMSLKFKELFLCTNEEEYKNTKRCIVDGIKAFHPPNG